MQREDKLTELADKKPRVAMVYGMAIAIGALFSGVISLLIYIKVLVADMRALEVAHRLELTEINTKNQERNDARDSTSTAKIEGRFETQAAIQEERIKELQKTVESLLNQSSAVKTQFQKMESKVDQVSGNTKKIEEVINQ
ncbi:hypothetical protein DYBT9623_04425 [Dyadobacter sp. CECT 9623]|uniref:Uncharacterized protein n=1 Tax=Dyadobacter linearis TaxID=2823330 RepID=A0ABM8UVQ8_9BACT|nr:hypothetical protein [Dyadobacter sp. CECT 9623]CAG5072886.1 hypothetical protein DYBT9623_04425 [Dyadobacter sp. CECT 9623]